MGHNFPSKEYGHEVFAGIALTARNKEHQISRKSACEDRSDIYLQAVLQSKFDEYSKVPGRLTGEETALKMLRDNGIYDVKVTSVGGVLTDHYNPATKTINLSEGVFASRSVAADYRTHKEPESADFLFLSGTRSAFCGTYQSCSKKY